MTRRTGFVSKTAGLALKDLRIERRAKDTLPPMLAFTLCVTLLLTFALPAPSGIEGSVDVGVGSVRIADVLAGFLWVTVLFAGLIAFARTFEVEREEAALDSMLLLPVDRSALFLGKALANLVFVVGVEVLLIPAFVLLFSLPLEGGVGLLVLIALMVDVGFVALGTLFAALAARTRSRELLLPVLALPSLVPVFIAAVELTSDLFAGQGLEAVTARGWFGILIAFDVIIGVIAALGFEYAID